MRRDGSGNLSDGGLMSHLLVLHIGLTLFHARGVMASEEGHRTCDITDEDGVADQDAVANKHAVTNQHTVTDQHAIADQHSVADQNTRCKNHRSATQWTAIT